MKFILKNVFQSWGKSRGKKIIASPPTRSLDSSGRATKIFICGSSASRRTCSRPHPSTWDTVSTMDLPLRIMNVLQSLTIMFGSCILAVADAPATEHLIMYGTAWKGPHAEQNVLEALALGYRAFDTANVYPARHDSADHHFAQLRPGFSLFVFVSCDGFRSRYYGPIVAYRHRTTRPRWARRWSGRAVPGGCGARICTSRPSSPPGSPRCRGSAPTARGTPSSACSTKMQTWPLR